MSTSPEPNGSWLAAPPTLLPVEPPPLVMLLFWVLVVAYVAMIVTATLRVARKGTGVEVPIWIFAIVLLPFIGAIGAAAHYKDR